MAKGNLSIERQSYVEWGAESHSSGVGWGSGRRSKRFRLRIAYRRRSNDPPNRIKLHMGRIKVGSSSPRSSLWAPISSRFAKTPKRQQRHRELAPLASVKDSICITESKSPTVVNSGLFARNHKWSSDSLVRIIIRVGIFFSEFPGALEWVGFSPYTNTRRDLFRTMYER